MSTEASNRGTIEGQLIYPSPTCEYPRGINVRGKKPEYDKSQVISCVLYLNEWHFYFNFTNPGLSVPISKVNLEYKKVLKYFTFIQRCTGGR